MRAAAILFVVCSHALWVLPESEVPLSSLIRFSGFMGVEIFFVLSGFLIGRIMLRIFLDPDYHHRNLQYFIVRRWFRTLPNYYIVLVVNVFIALYLGRELPDSLVQYFFFLQNYASGMDIFFTESWSLPIEEFAYILGPALLFLVALPKSSVSREKRFLGVTLTIILLFLINKVSYHLSYGATSMDFWNIELKAVVVYRIDAIYYGVLAAYLAYKFPTRWKNLQKEIFVGGLLLFALFHLLIAKFNLSSETQPLIFNVFYFPICSVLIASSLPFLSQWKKAPNHWRNPVTFISVISYSMYLLHYSIVLQLMRYELNIDPESIWFKWMFSIGYLLITILLSYGLYTFYEKPLMDLRDKAYFRKMQQPK